MYWVARKDQPHPVRRLYEQYFIFSDAEGYVLVRV